MSHRRILLLFLVFLALLSGTTYVILFRTGAATGFVEELIGKSIRRNLFQMDEAEIDLAGGRVTIREFQLADPKAAGDDPKLLSVDRVEVDLETNPLEMGTVRRVVLDGLEINLSLVDDEMVDLESIFQQAGVETEADGGFVLPTISVTNSRVRLKVVADRDPITFEKLQLELRRVEDDDKSVQLRGSMQTMRGKEVLIEGAGDLNAMDFRSVLTLRDLDIDATHATVFEAEARRFLEASKVTGRIEKAQMWLEYRGTDSAPGQRARGGAAIEFADLAVTPSEFPYPIVGATAKLYGETGDNGTLRFQLAKQGVDGDVNVQGEIRECFSTAPRIEVQAEAKDILVGPRLHQAIEAGSLAALRDIRAAFAPTAGRLTTNIQVYSRADGELDASADIQLNGLSGRFFGFKQRDGTQIGFPYPLRNVNGLITLRSDRIHVEGVTGDGVGGGAVTVTGQVTDILADPRINLDIACKQVPFSANVRSSLAHIIDEAPAIYDEFTPEGQTDLTVRLRDDGRGLDFTVLLQPLDASAAYTLFPYRLNHLTGEITITSQGAFIDIDGRRNDTTASIDGRFLYPRDAAKGLRSELQVIARNSTFTPELYRACNHLHPAIGDFWRRVQPKGTHDVEVTLWREFGTADFSYDVHVGVRDASIVLADLPMPVKNLKGDVFVHGTGDSVRCDISPIRGEIDNGPGQPPALALTQGTVLDLGGNPTAEITSIIQRLRLTPALGAALAKGGILPESTWTSLALDGFADVTARHEQRANAATLFSTYRLRLRDVTSAATVLPGERAAGLHGEILIEDEVARFEKIEGLIDQTPVAILGGRVLREGTDTVVSFVASADSYPLDDRLAKSMAPEIRNSYLGLQMRGRARLNQVHVTFRFPDDGSPFRSEFHGDIEARDVFLDVGLPGGHSIKHLNGTVTITNGNHDRLEGSLKNARFELTDQQIDRIHSRFEIDTKRLVLNGLTFQLAGGRVRGGTATDPTSFSYEFTDKGKIYAYLAYESLRLKDLLRSSALSRSKVRGTADGKVVIEHFEGLDFLTLRAFGDIEVRDGWLGTVPLFSAIYNHIREEKRPQFTRGKVKFRVGGQKIDFQDLEVHSSLVRVGGGGTLDMDGYMDIDLEANVFDSATDILILPRVLNEVVKQIAQFKVFGYLRNPRIEPVLPFSRPIERQPLVPIPPLPVVSAPAPASGPRNSTRR